MTITVRMIENYHFLPYNAIIKYSPDSVMCISHISVEIESLALHWMPDDNATNGFVFFVFLLYLFCICLIFVLYLYYIFEIESLALHWMPDDGATSGFVLFVFILYLFCICLIFVLYFCICIMYLK